MRSKKRIMPSLAKLPELGTREAAVKGCVSMIAHLCGQPEETVQYWLDLYFQVRLAWAVEEDRIRREDRRVEHGLQVLRQSIQPDVARSRTPCRITPLSWHRPRRPARRWPFHRSRRRRQRVS